MSINFRDSKNENLYIDFTIKNTSTSLVNGIRRILLRDIPIVAFDIDNIKININNTSVHNEFLSHRISLVPIDNHLFKIKSFYNSSKKERQYEFIDKPDSFILKEKNNNNYNESNNYITITSNDFKLNDKKAIDYFKPEPFFKDSKEYILIIYLKVNKNNSEEIDIECKPTIGFSKNNDASYNPTGTVTYHFIKEEESVINTKMNQYITYIQNERKNKNLEQLSDNEIKNIEEDFKILESDRIYKKNEFYLKIESVGNLYPYELLYNSIIIFQLKLVDLLLNISFVNDKLIFNKLINIDRNNDLIINNENHTLGNVICHYILKNYKNIYIEYCSYRIVHPLKNDIIMSIKLYDKTLDKIPNKLFYLDNEYNIKYVEDNDNHLIYIFEYSIINILSDLNQLKNQISSNYKINKTNFDIDYYDNIKNIINIT